MKKADIKTLASGSPMQRTESALRLGAELEQKRKRKLAMGQLPKPLRSARVTGLSQAMLENLHGLKVETATAERGLSTVGTYRVKGREVPALVLSRNTRKREATRVLRAVARENVQNRAIAQLAVGMLDSEPVPRIASSYGYWQATGAKQAVVPVLDQCLETDDEDTFQMAATALAKIDPRKANTRLAAAPERPSRRRRTTRRRASRSMTVIVHGTFAQGYSWYQPGGGFHTYIKRNVYPDVYSGQDFFRWSGSYSHSRRIAAANELIGWCNQHPTHLLRLIGHSHGCSVISLALQRGLQACTVIYCSPAVESRYLPKMSNISSGTFFNFHPRVDYIIWLDGSDQDFTNTPVAAHEQRRISANSGHSSSHEPQRWRKKKIPTLVKQVC